MYGGGQEKFAKWPASVRVVQVFGRPALVLPYFEQVPVGERAAALEPVRALLRDTFHQRGYRHAEVKWRHVARYVDDGSWVYVMLDLGLMNTAPESATWCDEAVEGLGVTK